MWPKLTFFRSGLASRLSNRPQLSTDGYRSYPDAVEDAFGPDVDYAMVIKSYDDTSVLNGAKTGIYHHRITGNPNPDYISTSYIERLNLTIRMSVRRYTRRTNAFSKKFENHAYAMALFFMYYNFVRIHQTLRMTPAMAAGVTDFLWDWKDVLLLAFPERV